MPIPVEWKFAALAINPAGPATITIPAPDFNIRRVVTGFTARLYNGGVGFVGPNIELTDSAFLLITWPLWTNAPAGSSETAAIEDDGPWMAGLGSALILRFNAAPAAGVQQHLTLKGYDL